METKTLSSAIKKIAVAYIFIYLHINIGSIDILPNWVGYIMIITALPILAQKVNSSILLKPFGIILCIYSGVNFLINIVGINYGIIVHIVSVLLGIISIYFHFQLITNIAEITFEEARKKRLLFLRTAGVIIDTITMLISCLPMLLDEEIYTYISLFLIIPRCVICFWIAGELFGLSKTLNAEEIENCENTDLTENTEESGINEQ